MFVPVCVFCRAAQTVMLSPRQTQMAGVTHATPINPKTHRNLTNAGAGGREGGEGRGDLSSPQTVSFDSEQKN